MNELNFNNFMKSKVNQRIWENYMEHHEEPTVYHKMATAWKISKKRLVKILMASGYSRDDAQKRARCILCREGGYIDWYFRNVHILLWKIQHRLGPTERLMDAIFEGNLPKNIRESARKHDSLSKKSFDFGKSAEDLKKEYEELIELQKKYPECVDRESCREVKNKKIAEFIKNGSMTEVQQTLFDISKLSCFYIYSED